MFPVLLPRTNETKTLTVLPVLLTEEELTLLLATSRGGTILLKRKLKLVKSLRVIDDCLCIIEN